MTSSSKKHKTNDDSFYLNIAIHSRVFLSLTS